jgi:branched-subunit amino acid transport protein
MLWLLIGAMALITFYNRYAFFSPRLKFFIRPEIQSILQYTAPAVLTALWVPIVFVKDGTLNTQWNDPYLLAGAVTVVVSATLKKPLPAVLIGVTVFYLCRVFG